MTSSGGVAADGAAAGVMLSSQQQQQPQQQQVTYLTAPTVATSTGQQFTLHQVSRVTLL